MKIGIVGLGLIGGSMGLDLRRLGFHVLGVSRQQETCDKAIAKGVVDEASVNLSLLSSADAVFICTPLTKIASTVEQLVPHLSSAAIVTDVGSVKAPIVEALSTLWPNFVGGHPMAGTAESGIDAAQRSLFTGRPYVVTPVAGTPKTAITVVVDIAKALGADVYQCRPEAHDQAVAWISHLPVIVSASLIAACATESDPDVARLAQQLASSGFRDTSRVGGGNPELGTLMAQYNKPALLQAISTYQQVLTELAGAIEQENWEEIHQKLKETQQVRKRYVKD